MAVYRACFLARTNKVKTDSYSVLKCVVNSRVSSALSISLHTWISVESFACIYIRCRHKVKNGPKLKWSEVKKKVKKNTEAVWEEIEKNKKKILELRKDNYLLHVRFPLFSQGIILNINSPPILNSLKSWRWLVIVTGEGGTELFPCNFSPQNIKYTTILLHQITLPFYWII